MSVLPAVRVLSRDRPRNWYVPSSSARATDEGPSAAFERAAMRCPSDAQGLPTWTERQRMTSTRELGWRSNGRAQDAPMDTMIFLRRRCRRRISNVRRIGCCFNGPMHQVPRGSAPPPHVCKCRPVQTPARHPHEGEPLELVPHSSPPRRMSPCLKPNDLLRGRQAQQSFTGSPRAYVRISARIGEFQGGVLPSRQMYSKRGRQAADDVSPGLRCSRPTPRRARRDLTVHGAGRASARCTPARDLDQLWGSYRRECHLLRCMERINNGRADEAEPSSGCPPPAEARGLHRASRRWP
jgi:hypothetical protein